MRYSRVRRKRRQRNYARIFIIGLLLFIVLYVVSAGAIGKYLSGIIASRLGDMDEDSGLDGMDKDEIVEPKENADGSKTHESDNKEIKKITETIKVEPLTIYTIQLAAFSTEENAREFAVAIKDRGGGGYIIEDKYFRVLAVGYIGEDDINKVKTQLEEENIKCEIYKISCPGANMQVTASKEKVEGVNAAFSLWQTKLKDLEDVVKDVDSKNITEEAAYARLREIKLAMEETLVKLNDYKAAEGSSAILTGLEDMCKLGVESFDGLLDGNNVNGVVFSSKIKYTYIDMVYIYKKYMEDIVKK